MNPPGPASTAHPTPPVRAPERNGEGGAATLLAPDEDLGHIKRSLRIRMRVAAEEWRRVDLRCAELGLHLSSPGPDRPLGRRERHLITDRDAIWLTYLEARDAYAGCALAGGAAVEGTSGSQTTPRRITLRSPISTDTAPGPIGCYSQGFARDGVIAVSGQVGMDPRTGAMVDGGVAAQSRQALANVHAVLAAKGASWPDVIKLGVYLADTSDVGELNTVFELLVPRPYPARTTVGASLPDGVLVEIDALAIHLDVD